MSIRNKKLIVAFDPEKIKEIVGKPVLPPLNLIFKPRDMSNYNYPRRKVLGRFITWDTPNDSGYVFDKLPPREFLHELLGNWEHEFRYKTLAVEVFELYDYNADHVNLHGYYSQDLLGVLCGFSFELALNMGFEGHHFDWFKCVWDARKTYWRTQRVREKPRNTEQLNGVDIP